MVCNLKRPHIFQVTKISICVEDSEGIPVLTLRLPLQDATIPFLPLSPCGEGMDTFVPNLFLAIRGPEPGTHLPHCFSKLCAFLGSEPQTQIWWEPSQVPLCCVQGEPSPHST